jgi:hypothetical protein
MYPEFIKSSLRELSKLRTQRERAQNEGRQGDLHALDEEIAAIEASLRLQGQAGDTGERARNNVRKAFTINRTGKSGVEVLIAFGKLGFPNGKRLFPPFRRQPEWRFFFAAGKAKKIDDA